MDDGQENMDDYSLKLLAITRACQVLPRVRSRGTRGHRRSRAAPHVEFEATLEAKLPLLQRATHPCLSNTLPTWRISLSSPTCRRRHPPYKRIPPLIKISHHPPSEVPSHFPPRPFKDRPLPPHFVTLFSPQTPNLLSSPLIASLSGHPMG